MSWFLMNTVARVGHQPSSPGGLPAPSRRRQYCVFFTASCRTPGNGFRLTPATGNQSEDWPPSARDSAQSLQAGGQKLHVQWLWSC